jgi:hypothetical protein
VISIPSSELDITGSDALTYYMPLQSAFYALNVVSLITYSAMSLLLMLIYMFLCLYGYSVKNQTSPTMHISFAAN